jgi:7,8-dihydro-6-hydroxymethylpterin dimethyltransferase
MLAHSSATVLNITESLCPVCMRRIEARVVSRDSVVYLEKTCPEHGHSNVTLWPNAEHYQWMDEFRLPNSSPVTQTGLQDGCPFDCGLCPSHARRPTLVEIEVTLRCNLHCPVCFIAAGNAPQDPSLEALEKIYASILQVAGSDTSIQLTGGEPTVRNELPEIVYLGRQMGFQAIEVNTNGVVIANSLEYLRALLEAGITGIYLQFDGLTTEVYQHIRGRDLLSEKLQAIENCRCLGTQVVLAMTVVAGINENQIGSILDFALGNMDVVAGIALQPAFTSGRFEVTPSLRLGMGDVIHMLAEQSKGRIEVKDLWPLGCSHPLCSCATHLYYNGQELQPMTRLISPAEYRMRFNPNSPQGSIFADILEQKGLAGDNQGQRGRGLSIVVMNYMDAWTVDVDRLKECSMLVALKDGRLIPFCAYHLSNKEGERLYPR